MRMINWLTIGFSLVLLTATTAQAGVSIVFTNDTGGATVPVGQSFDVDVVMGYDGSPARLNAIGTSLVFDETQLEFVGASGQGFAPIFCGAEGCLSRLAAAGSTFANDPAGTLRVVQYGASPGQYGGAGDDTFIATLTFMVIDEGDGMAEITGVINDEGVFFNLMEGTPADYTLGATVVNVPEPASAALALSALGTVAFVARRRSGKGIE